MVVLSLSLFLTLPRSKHIKSLILWVQRGILQIVDIEGEREHINLFHGDSFESLETDGTIEIGRENGDEIVQLQILRKLKGRRRERGSVR
jgi:hypothetical protein